METLVENDIAAKLVELRGVVERGLSRYRDSRQPAILYEPIRYVLEGGGKRIRPVLLLLTCCAVGGRVDDGLDAAAAVELMHNFTLVHDDIMDQDDTRRGRPTVHKRWNVGVALLAGDGLVALAYQTLLQSRSRHIAEVARVFTDGVVELCEGQALDLEFETHTNVGLEDYLTMIEKKTASLLSVSAKMGAILGGGTREQVAAMGDFGLNLGRAFQIQDDLLDITTQEAISGKTFGSDVLRRKQTYLLIHALAHASDEEKKRLSDFLAKPEIETSEIVEIRKLYENIGSIQAAQNEVRNYLSAAEDNLQALQPSDARHDLLQLLRFIARRNA